MTTQRLADILDEVADLQREMKKLLDEAIVLSGRAVGDEMMLRGRRVTIIRLEANVAMPFIDKQRRLALSLRVICAPHRANGTLMTRNTMTLIERLATEWANIAPPAPSLPAVKAKPANPFAHGLQTLQNLPAVERRQGERRGYGPNRRNNVVK